MSTPPGDGDPARPGASRPPTPRPGFQRPTPGSEHTSHVGGLPFVNAGSARRSLFNAADLPTELKISYYLWVVGGLLGAVVSILGLFASLILSPSAADGGYAGALALAIAGAAVGLILSVAQILLALKMKEARRWARTALTALAAVSLVSALGSQSWFGFVVAVVAGALMWVPRSQAWFLNRGSAN